MNAILAIFNTNARRPLPAIRGGALLLSALLLLHPAPQAAAIEIYTLQVPADRAWIDTGIYVTAGSPLEITATGMVTYWLDANKQTDANGVNWDGRRFIANSVIENTTVISLIGKIGGTTNIGTGIPVPEGVPGYGAGFVGTSYSQVIPVSGELFLGFNDIIGSTGDNSGSFTAVVMVPEPSAVALAAMAGVILLVRARKAAGQSPHPQTADGRSKPLHPTQV